MSVGFGEEVEIIPVIDLMGGKVVQAKGGHRSDYQTIRSTLTEAVDLFTVVEDVLAFFPFKTIYIADLDAITGKVIDVNRYRQCLARFPAVEFWLDAGIKDHQDWQQIDSLTGLIPVLGSESLEAITLLQHPTSILSLDFKQGDFLGDEQLLKETSLWPEQVIVMNLDAVGSMQGPDLCLLQRIKKAKPSVTVVAAGGVRDSGDLVRLAGVGVDKVLVASALHRSVFSREDLTRYQ